MNWKRNFEDLKESASAGDHCGDPSCPCHSYRRRPTYPGQECSLGKPLWMVIPPQGIHISCPVHGKHFIPGNVATCRVEGSIPMWRIA